MRTKITLALIAITSVLAASAYDFKVGNLCYNKNSDGKTVTVTHENSNEGYTSLSGAVSIPSKVTNNGTSYTVTAIDSWTFRKCSGITSVTVPNTVTTIGDRAFDSCTGMTSITLGSSLTTIGAYVFCDCTSLTSLTIPNSVTTIKGSTFLDCTALKSITIGTGVTSMGYRSFSTCTALTSVKWNAKNYPDCTYNNTPLNAMSGSVTLEFGSTVTRIPDYLCYGATGIKSVTIPKTVTEVGHHAFDGCTNLAWVDITDLAAWCKISFPGPTSNPLSVAGNLYLNGTKITELTVPSSITEIKDYAFYNCIALKSATIGSSVKTIGICAFDSCRQLGSVSFANSVQKIGTSAFCHCSALTSVAPGNSVTELGYGAFQDCTGLTSVTLGSSLKSIGDYCFINCSGLTAITIPAAAESIGYHPFSGCTNLKTVNWNAKNCADLSSNSDGPFYNLTGITTFNFGNTVEHIPAYICYGLTGLTTVTVGTGVTSVGTSAFGGCTGMATVNWNAANCADQSSYGPFGNMSSITKFAFGSQVKRIPSYLCYALKGLASVTIPNSVTTIGNYAFSQCENLTSATIGSSVATIGEYAFTSSGLTSITIPNSVTSIGNYAFYYCTSASSATIGTSVATIGESAFSMCSGLTTVTIPPSVTSIGGRAFNSCTGMTSVKISDMEAWCCIDFGNDPSNPLRYAHNLYLNDTKVTSLSIPSSVSAIKSYTFYGGTCFTSVTIPNSVTSIGISAFQNCSGLKSLTIPASVTSISSYSFNGCSGLTSLIIPNSVTTINQYAFSGCSGLTSITVPASVTYVGRSAFKDCTALANMKWDARTSPDITPPVANYSPLYGCKNLASIEFGHTVERIPRYLCVDLTGLKRVIIGRAVAEIGDNAFRNCSALERIGSFPDPAGITLSGTNTFYGVPRASCELHVLPVYLEDYTKAAQWKTFTNIIGDLNEVPGNLNGDDSVDSSDVSILLEMVLEGAAYAIAADINGDGSIDSADVSALLEIVLEGSN